MRKFAPGRTWRGALVLASLLALGGCGMFSHDDGRYDPAPLTEYKAGTTTLKDPAHFNIMAQVAGPLTEQEIQALASYLQGLHARADDLAAAKAGGK